MAKYEIKDGVGIIPEGTTKIEPSLFENKDKITSVIIPDSVTEIGVDSFAGCENLKKVTIPSSVTTIEDGAFWCCESLTKIVIPASVNKIGHSILGGCSSLESIVVEKENKTFDSRNNCNAIVETATNRLIACCSKTTIPSSVAEIGFTAFRGCEGLEEISIPDSVSKIGANAFDGCSNLVSLTIPNSVTEIGEYAFCACENLGSITIPDSVKEIEDSAFSECRRMTNITLPDSIQKIGNHLFYKCSNLTDIILPSSVKEIGESAFAFTSLTTIPGSVVKIGAYAFAACSHFENIIIPDSVTEIGKNAFRSCSHLSSITIPGSVTTIGEDAFKNCDALESIQVPEGKEQDFKKLLPEELHNLIGRKVETTIPPTPKTPEVIIEELCSRIKGRLEALGMNEYVLYASDYYGDFDEDPDFDEYSWEQKMEEYPAYEWVFSNKESKDGYSAKLILPRKIKIKGNIIVYDLEKVYQDIDGGCEVQGSYKDQTIASVLKKCPIDLVQQSLQVIIDGAFTPEMVELNKTHKS